MAKPDAQRCRGTHWQQVRCPARHSTDAQPTYDPRAGNVPVDSGVREVRPTGNETKLSFLTTEFWVYLAAVAGVLIASYAVGTNANHNDYFRADKAWWFIALLTIGYLVSRGLAKAGSPTRSKIRDNARR